MKCIYLIIDKNNALVKIGYTSNLTQRIYQYTTANPKAYIRDYCKIYEKTGRSLEKQAQAELRRLGGIPVIATMDGKITEWYDLENNPMVLQGLLTDGLQALTICQGRKSLGVYIKPRR